MTRSKPRRIIRFSLWVLGIATLAFPLPLSAMQWSQVELERAHELLSWGEFDSVIQVLKPSFHPDSVASDSMGIAWSWLGIAYHGLGNTASGDAAFRNFLSHRLEHDLEPSLATPEMKARFAHLKQEIGSIASESAHAKQNSPDSVFPVAPAPNSHRTDSNSMSAARTRSKPGGKIGTKSAWVIGTVGVAALVSGVGAIWWYRSQPKTKTVITVMDGREEK